MASSIFLQRSTKKLFIAVGCYFVGLFSFPMMKLTFMFILLPIPMGAIGGLFNLLGVLDSRKIETNDKLEEDKKYLLLITHAILLIAIICFFVLFVHGLANFRLG